MNEPEPPRLAERNTEVHSHHLVALRPRKGEDALLTWANVVTLARVALVPAFILALLGDTSGPHWIASILWVILSGSDGLDGYLARREGVTDAGAFLDPLADKILVLSALVALGAEGRAPLGALIVILTRELLISAFRSVAVAKGVVVRATYLAKVKTASQMLAVFLALVLVEADAQSVVDIAMWFAAALSLISGVDYVLRARSYFAAHGTTTEG